MDGFVHPPDAAVRLPRRRFLAWAAGGAAAAALPSPAEGLSRTPEPPQAPPSLPTPPVELDETFWALVKKQFPLRPGLTIMNAANLCPAPYVVSDTVYQWTREVDADATFQSRGRFGELRTAAMEALARYVGAASDEVVITRNTTEGNNVVAGGLDLGRGDEVLLWDQNHPSNSGPWEVGARRFGYEVVSVGTPPQPTGVEELVAAFADAMSPRTRVLAFSHHSNLSGIALPAAELCRLARDRGVLTLVDGAQTFGWLRLDLNAMGCDFYTASSHKWFLGPKEAGVLYVRRESVERVWPMVVGLGWERAQEEAGASRFGTLGQRDDATVVAMGDAVTFLESIGRPNIEARVRELVSVMRIGLEERIPDVRFHAPASPALSGGVLKLAFPGLDPRAAFRTLYDEHLIGSAAQTGRFAGLRLSPHIYNMRSEAERVVEAVAGLA